jgi:hypothetical protein
MDTGPQRRRMMAMTIPIVSERLLVLEPLAADGFAVIVARDAASADLPLSRRRIVD